MKKFLVIMIAIVLVISFCACDDGSKAIEEAVNNALDQATTLVASGKAEEAYNLLGEVKALDLLEEQSEKIKTYRNNILQMCFPGTFIIRPDVLTEVRVRLDDTDLYTIKNTMSALSNGTKGSTFVYYLCDKNTEKELVAQQYKDFLSQQYTFIDITTKNNVTHYIYADEVGRSIDVGVFEKDNRITILIDLDFYNLDLVDKSDDSKSIYDLSIINKE